MGKQRRGIQKIVEGGRPERNNMREGGKGGKVEGMEEEWMEGGRERMVGGEEGRK